ncbi:unnamed protein product [Closterium sp. Naga37s-1]|nr:unnamed protein product [Closterium sp. Naga37s-1]
MFHTFSNTGWLTYGAVLNRLHDKYGKPAIDAAIKGCVVDSAPILEQDPQVWARGFAAAILQKRSSATRAGRTDVSATAEASAAADSAVTASESSSSGGAAKGSSEGVEKEANGKVWGVTETGEWDAQPRDETRSAAIDARPVASDGPKHHHRSSLGFASLTAEMDVVGEGEEGEERRRSAGGVAGVRAGEGVGVEKVVKAEEDAVEKTLLNVLRRFFTWVLQLPVVKTKLDTVTNTLASEQPECPQLYLYSTADAVIPAEAVESFIQRQRLRGCAVMFKRFDSSPHVDHYRTFPEIYSAELEAFLKKCLQQPKQQQQQQQQDKNVRQKGNGGKTGFGRLQPAFAMAESQ